jgi:hypothetical protein
MVHGAKTGDCQEVQPTPGGALSMIMHTPPQPIRSADPANRLPVGGGAYLAASPCRSCRNKKESKATFWACMKCQSTGLLAPLQGEVEKPLTQEALFPEKLKAKKKKFEVHRKAWWLQKLEEARPYREKGYFWPEIGPLLGVNGQTLGNKAAEYNWGGSNLKGLTKAVKARRYQMRKEKRHVL